VNFCGAHKAEISLQEMVASEPVEVGFLVTYPMTEVWEKGCGSLSIPDNDPAGVSCYMIVSGQAAITDLNVELEIAHTRQGDLKVDLQHVQSGSTATLIDRVGVDPVCAGSGYGYTADDFGKAFQRLLLDDGAPVPINPYDGCSGNGIDGYHGPAFPDGPLAAFVGESAAGVWRVTVRDLAAGETGTLESVALHVTTEPDPCHAKYVQSDWSLGDLPWYQTPEAWGTILLGDESEAGETYFVQTEYRNLVGETGLGQSVAGTFWNVWGDVNNSQGLVDLQDILCVLDAFAGTFINCTRCSTDLVSEDYCQPDGDIDLLDVLAVLDAYAGQPYPCAGPCGQGACCNGTTCAITTEATCTGSFEGEGTDCWPNDCGTESSGAQAVTLSLVPRQQEYERDDIVDVDLFVSGVSDLRGYQVAVDVAVNGRQRLDLVGMSIENDREDYLYRARDRVEAFDASRTRLLSALYTNGAEREEQSYLATYTFRAADVGEFQVNVRVARDTFLVSSRYERLTVESASPARFDVR